jgi:hypothetical protein
LPPETGPRTVSKPTVILRSLIINEGLPKILGQTGGRGGIPLAKHPAPLGNSLLPQVSEFPKILDAPINDYW